MERAYIPVENGRNEELGYSGGSTKRFRSIYEKGLAIKIKGPGLCPYINVFSITHIPYIILHNGFDFEIATTLEPRGSLLLMASE